MNRLTFHNRDQIFQDYTAKKGHNRCIYCDFEYHQDYTKQQNTFMWAGCDYHLAHRQCIIQHFGRGVQINRLSCGLCLRVAHLEKSNMRVMRRWQQRIARELEQQQQYYDQICKQVEKTGVYKLK